MIHKAILTLALAASTVAMAQTESSTYTPGVTLDGVNYYLPRTALRVVVEAERTNTYPGELHPYAYRYLMLTDVATQASTQWTIKRVSVEPYSVADTQRIYNVRLKGRTSAPLVSLSRDGILLSVNTEAAEAAPLQALPASTQEPRHDSPRRYLDKEILSAGSTAKMAQLVATQIEDLRDARRTVAKGEAENTPKDGEQLRLMLNELERETTALEEMFTGYTATTTHYFEFRHIPTQASGSDIIFRFSPTYGVLPADDLSGDPVYLQCQNIDQLPVRQTNEDTDKKKAKMEQGIYYCVPLREGVAITHQGTTLYSGEFSMAQFGNVEILSNLLFDKKNTFKATFDPITGAVRKISE